MDDIRPKIKEPGFWAWALHFVLMWTLAIVAVLGFSRFLNTLVRRGVIFELDFPSWLPTYLMVTGFIQLAFGMTAYIAMKERRTWQLPALSVTAMLTIIIAWVERLVLWSPDQQPGNHGFTVVLHLVWLIMIGVYIYLSTKKEAVDGSGD